jgi:hypothetical protein
VRLGLDLAVMELDRALREFVRTRWPDETRGIDAVFDVRVGDPTEMILDAATDDVDVVGRTPVASPVVLL